MLHIGYLLLFTLLMVNYMECWRPYTLSFTGVECNKKSQLISNINCTLTRVSRRLSGFSFNILVGEEVRRANLDASLVYLRQHDTALVVFNFTDIDVCQFFQNTLELNILQVLRKQLYKYANLPKQCPVPKGSVISIRNFIFNPESFPAYMPVGDYTGRLQVSYKTKPLFEFIANSSCALKDQSKKARSGKHFLDDTLDKI